MKGSMKTEHTPGPWAWQKFGKEWCLTGQHSMRPIVLAYNRKIGMTSLVNGLLVPLDTNHPDAVLITAPPELLDNLRAACNVIELLLPLIPISNDRWSDAGLTEKGRAEVAAHLSEFKSVVAKATGGVS